MAGAAGRERDPLLRSEIHGFITYADLNFEKLKAEAASRWFRPNEIYAVLANHERFKVHAQPIDKPVVLLFYMTAKLSGTSGRMAIIGRKRRMAKLSKKPMKN
ncbi:hypothetical protein ACQJBY_015648 [Aegilops geniculata]